MDHYKTIINDTENTGKVDSEGYRGYEYISASRRISRTSPTSEPAAFITAIDMNYFSLTPATLKKRRLKIASFTCMSLPFEVCSQAQQAGFLQPVLGNDKQVLEYIRLVPERKGQDSILEHSLVESDLMTDAWTGIEQGVNYQGC
jgi:hypothetical protein